RGSGRRAPRRSSRSWHAGTGRASSRAAATRASGRRRTVPSSRRSRHTPAPSPPRSFARTWATARRPSPAWCRRCASGVPTSRSRRRCRRTRSGFGCSNAVSQLLIAASERAPILLVLDDLHWADRDTIAMLRHVARAVARHRMLVLGLYRDVELDRQHALADALGALRRGAPYARVALKALDVAGGGHPID